MPQADIIGASDEDTAAAQAWLVALGGETIRVAELGTTITASFSGPRNQWVLAVAMRRCRASGFSRFSSPSIATSWLTVAERFDATVLQWRLDRQRAALEEAATAGGHPRHSPRLFRPASVGHERHGPLAQARPRCGQLHCSGVQRVGAETSVWHSGRPPGQQRCHPPDGVGPWHLRVSPPFPLQIGWGGGIYVPVAPAACHTAVVTDAAES